MSYQPAEPRLLAMGATTFDVTSRALVMGILNRTTDSFYEPAATFDLDALFARAEQLVAQGADLLDIGGVKAGPGDDVSETEELDRVAVVVKELCARFDLPVSIDTWRASVAEACFGEGACVGNDISGFADPDYLKVAAAAGATVVATHIRLAPRVADPDPHYDDVTRTVCDFLIERRQWALDAGVTSERIIVDAGLDLGKTASNKTFLGVMFDLAVTDRREPSLAATALGIASGCRVVRVHDVAGTVRVRDVLARVMEAAS